ncbi:hypothetical protein QEG73_03925 [Chitinophagaceae bacterium 26-R-25]|nr:hypothetical protein [Chitinophagaceae bacterium 26-R-25]
MKKLLTGLCIVAVSIQANSVLAQAGAGTKYGPKQQAYVDSIKNSDYKWTLPILGKKASGKGFDLPYNSGIMLNTLFAKQKVLISDLKVGFNDMEPVPLEFIKFGDVVAKTQSVTVRPDVWILPFLDLYAIGGFSTAQTNVSIVEPFVMNTNAKFHGNTFGLGTTFAAGYHGFISIIDFNHTWTHMDKISGTISANMIDARLGKNFLMKDKPYRSIAVWVGAQGFFINRTTEGTINLADLKTDASLSDMESIVNETAGWYQNLTPAQKIVMKQLAQAVINKINNGGDKDVIVHYSLNKRPTSDWSMCVGGQFQFSHSWQVRTEVGFLGGRSSLLLSANYRFRLFKRHD